MHCFRVEGTGGGAACQADGPVLITARKTPDGGAAGRVEYERAGFMPARLDPGCPPQNLTPGLADDVDGDDITTSPYPVVDPAWGWELDAVLSVTTPGLTYSTSASPDTGITTTWITHPDGSWARACGRPGQPAAVHQAGPRRLWDILDAIRADWPSHGYLPLWGARQDRARRHLPPQQRPPARHHRTPGHPAARAARRTGRDRSNGRDRFRDQDGARSLAVAKWRADARRAFPTKGAAPVWLRGPTKFRRQRLIARTRIGMAAARAAAA